MSDPQVDRYIRLAAEKAADLEVGESVAVWQRNQLMTPSARAYRTEDGVKAYDGRRLRPSRWLGQPDLELQINRRTGKLEGVTAEHGHAFGNREHRSRSGLE